MDYQIIYADPPWRFRSNSVDKPGRNVRKEYPTMSVDKIATLNVKDIAAKDSMLLMWVTSPVLAEMNKVIEGWGFKFKGNFFAWVKQNKDETIFRGMGYHTRKNLELCVYGTRGAGIGRPADRSISEIILAPRGKHSEKPVEAYERIETMYPGTRKIELFARNTREGWHSWGNDPSYTNDVELRFTDSLDDYF